MLGDDAAIAHLARHAPHNGGGAEARRMAEAALRFGRALRRVQEWEVVVRDLGAGICDFPGRVDGRDVWLCWRHGEDAVAWWHDLDAGFAGRRPLPDPG